MRWLSLACVGCAPPLPSGELDPDRLATEVVQAPGHTGERFGDAFLATNGVRGEGELAGSLDVFSLGTEPGVDDVLVLGWHGAAVLDRDGPDLAVFENPFDVSGGGRFMDPTVVEVSPDGTEWVAFEVGYTGGDTWSGDPGHWSGCAGLTPVSLHEERYPVDPLAEAAGGDRFDLADLDPDDPVTRLIEVEGVRFVRLSAASLWHDEAGVAFPSHPASNGPDIDGVYAADVQ